MKASTKKLYAAIRGDYKKLSETREYGTSKYTTIWILHRLADQYFKSPKTIENIVFKR